MCRGGARRRAPRTQLLGPPLLEVVRGRPQQRGIIAEASDPEIALAAKQRAQLARQVAMVDAQGLVGFLLADRAHAALLREHALVLLERNSVSGLEPEPARLSLLAEAFVLARIEAGAAARRRCGEGERAGSRILSVAQMLSLPPTALPVPGCHCDTAPTAVFGSQFAMADPLAATAATTSAAAPDCICAREKIFRHGGCAAMSRRSGHDR
jgi:hypothetical protein